MIFLHVYSCVHAYSCAFNAECSHKNYSTYADLYACTHTKPNSKCTWRGFRAVLTQFWRTRTRSYIAPKKNSLIFLCSSEWSARGAVLVHWDYELQNPHVSVILCGYFMLECMSVLQFWCTEITSYKLPMFCYFAWILYNKLTQMSAAQFWPAEERHLQFLEKTGQSAEKGCTTPIVVSDGLMRTFYSWFYFLWLR